MRPYRFDTGAAEEGQAIDVEPVREQNGEPDRELVEAAVVVQSADGLT